MEHIQLPSYYAFLISRFSFESYKIKQNINLFLSGRKTQKIRLLIFKIVKTWWIAGFTY